MRKRAKNGVVVAFQKAKIKFLVLLSRKTLVNTAIAGQVINWKR